MRFKDIYLDNGATTQVDPKVIKLMLPFFDKYYGNASSQHSIGNKAKEALDKSRRIIASLINAKPEEIIFTSGGTESDNLALRAVAYLKGKGKHIITTKIEHPAVLNTCKELEERGYQITYLNVDAEGFIDLEQLKQSLTENTILVSIIHANNEIGTIQNLKEIGKICQENNILFHTDAVQSFTKTELDVQKFNLDFVSLSGHKIHGPKGVGALYIRKGTEIKSLLTGGSQEFSLRPGTENIPGIVGLAAAAKLSSRSRHLKLITELNNKLINGIKEIENVKLNGPEENRLCNNVSVTFIGIDNQIMGDYLNQKMICASGGSACSSHSTKPSSVLKAIGLTDEDAKSTLRFTLSRFNTNEEIDYTIKTLKKLTNKLR
jgi:cysteine desulfurase